jgi:hypothetical protein
MSSFMSICAAKERECEELEIRVAQLEFLYKEATAQLAAINCSKNTKINQCQLIEDGDVSVISVSGSDVSVFDDDESVLAPNDDESIRVTRHSYVELPVSGSSHFYDEAEEVDEEEDDVFQDASAKAPSKYNKARYESASRTCLCGGRTSSIKSRAKIHESSAFHQKYLAHNEISSIE